MHPNQNPNQFNQIITEPNNYQTPTPTTFPNQPTVDQTMQIPNFPQNQFQSFSSQPPQLQAQPQPQTQPPQPQTQTQPQTETLSNDKSKSDALIDNQPKPNNPNSTQNSLQFAELKEGIIIMKDGSFKAVVSCKSINFDLMSGREREGIEFAYQGFLNSLYFPIQILVRSNKVDIGPYLEKLVKIRSSQDNMLLNVLMDDYLNFIEVLAQEANIMDKTFYVIIPYYLTSESLDDIKSQSKNLFSNLFSSNNTQTVKINAKNYTKAKEELQNRVDVIINGLTQVGVQAKRLNTEQLAQLFYNFYNPDISNREPLVNFDNLPIIYTKKGN